MDSPFVSIDDYPPARRVAFESSVPTDDWGDPPPVVTEYVRDLPVDIVLTRPYLTAMKVSDHLFAMQLVDDEALHATYIRLRTFGFPKNRIAANPLLKSSILTIERALKNRMDFAKHQKIHVMEQLPFISSESEKERVNEEADAEIKIVWSIIKDWTSDSLQDAIDDFEQTIANLMD